MKYKVGDIVTIREWEAMEREFGVNGNGDISNDISINFINSMRGFCGQKMRITRSGEYFYNMENDEVYSFTDEMIAHNFHYGEEIEVKDDISPNWFKAIFVGFIDGAQYSYAVVYDGCEEDFNEKRPFLTGYYKFARKIQPSPKFDITITKNGEPYNGKISIETARQLGIVEEEQ